MKGDDHSGVKHAVGGPTSHKMDERRIWVIGFGHCGLVVMGACVVVSALGYYWCLKLDCGCD